MTEFKEVSGKLTWTMEQLGLLATISSNDSTSNAKFGAVVKLRELIDAELAAEYDRGYETALDMETEPAKAEAWDEGFAEGARYGENIGSLDWASYPYVEEPSNPYRQGGVDPSLPS